MKYKVRDKVRIKSLDWYNENKDINNNVHCGDKVFDNYMSVFCGSVVTIGGVYPYNGYSIREDMHCRAWTDDMIEGLVEDAISFDTESEWLRHEISLPEGYQFKDENGNVINATKIVLEKKKKEYPKTYEECCKVLRVNPNNYLTIRNVYCFDGEEETVKYERDLLDKFHSLWKLLICRDAYWKIAGDEMELGKPWEPDWTSTNYKHCITTRKNKVEPLFEMNVGFIFAFPTEKMRETFYENFKEEIEKCKELL